MIPIEGHKNLFRDEKTGAIVNTDQFEYDQYFKVKNQKNSQKEELDRMRNDIDEIKFLLKQLVNPS